MKASFAILLALSGCVQTAGATVETDQVIPLAPVPRTCTKSEIDTINKWRLCAASTLDKCDALDCSPGHTKVAYRCKDGKGDGYPLTCPPVRQ